ncbi:AAA family ATPase [Algoriphagus aquimarinus]|uniref:AAA family ATPase n=1 Tax=Algoriphagus aquimarinus TaxID=237018 RepID=UPI0030DB6AE7|tara:strand:- start:23793 stop:24770 length:978 start_codon:yes stop_codon:yes gene_type:complete
MADIFQELLPIKSATEWIEESKLKPIPKRLFGDFWYEGELCFLFADTNVGKSILAVQIADSISKGGSVENLSNEVDPQEVLYYDFELSGKQFENRYSKDYSKHYQWDENFKRVQMSQDGRIPDGYTFDLFVATAIELAIKQNGFKILILDNLTYLTSNGGSSKEALAIMKKLNKWKLEHGLSILVLAHTPKRSNTKPITSNDLLGSKNLMNFCDSAFSIGQSNRDNNLKYLKQIKQRNGSQIYGSDNVWLCEIAKPDSFVKFEFAGFSTEMEHLKQVKQTEDSELELAAISMNADGLSLREIGKTLGISHMKVSRILKKYSDSSL